MSNRVVQNTDIAVNRVNVYDSQTGIFVTNIFRTLQGEAPFGGYPAVFLRLAGCNYGMKTNYCQFCDTSFQLAKSKHYTVDALYDAVLEQTVPGDILVLTGGEPTLQHQIIPMLKQLLEDGVYRLIQIETNLTNPAFFKEALAQGLPFTRSVEGEGVYIVGSPKANYKSFKTPRPTPEVEELVGTFKFLIDEEGTPHYAIPDWAHEVGKYRVYLSPIAVYAKPYIGEISSIWEDNLMNKEKTAVNYSRAAALCVEHGFKLSLQMHLFVGIA